MRLLAIGLLLSFILLMSTASASSVSRILPGSVLPGSTFKVQLQIDITDKETYFLIDEIYPFGFKVLSVEGGASLAQDGHIKWAVISGATSGILSYTLQSTASEGAYDFAGEYIFENQKDPLKIAGSTTIKVSKTFDCNDASVCKYGCDTLAKSVPMPCKIVPDTAPSPGTAEFDQTIWDMVKSMWDSSRVPVNDGLLAAIDKMSQKGRMSIGGTEYQVGQNGTLFIKLLDSNELPINTGFCYITAYYPNKTIKFMDNSPATFLENGLYYKDFFVPSVQGLYIADASCAYNDNVYRYNLPSEDAGYDGAVIGGTSPNPLTFRDIDCVNFQTGGGGTYQNWTFNYTSIGLINISTVSAIDVNWVGQISAAGGAIQIYDWNASIWDTLGSTLSSTGITLACGNNVYITRSRVLNFSSYIRNDTIKTRLFRAGTASMITDSVEVVIHSNSSIVANLRGTSELHVSDYFNGTSNLTVNLNGTQLSSVLTAIASVNQTLNTTILNYLIMINGTVININGTEYNSLLAAINSANATANNSNYLLGQLNLSLYGLGNNISGYYNNIMAMLASINNTLNTTLEYKLDLINGTVFQINQSTFNILQYLVSMNSSLTQYLVSINGTVFEINQSQYQNYLSILQAINNTNTSQYQQYIDLLNLLQQVNATTNTTLQLVMSINSTLWDDIFVILKDINYTTNTTLENKLDFINGTTWQTWLLLQNLTIGNVSVSANVNWTQGYIENSFLSFSDKVNGEEIQLFTESLSCLSNTTLQHLINGSKFINGVWYPFNQTVTEICAFGCSNNQCIPTPTLQYATAIGFALMVLGSMYVAYRAWK